MEPLALYIHWPFCLAKCPYCDFNSHVRDRVPQARFRAALRREQGWEADRLGRRPLGSIFFGGGTPSLMEPETVAALIDDARTNSMPSADWRSRWKPTPPASRPVGSPLPRGWREPAFARRAGLDGGAAHAGGAAFGGTGAGGAGDGAERSSRGCRST